MKRKKLKKFLRAINKLPWCERFLYLIIYSELEYLLKQKKKKRP